MALEAAYILPHPPLAIPDIGRGHEKRISHTIEAFEEVSRRIAIHQPDILVFISPHSAYFADWIYVAAGGQAQGTCASFGAPHLHFKFVYDEAFREILLDEIHTQGLPAGIISHSSQELDHGVMVPLFYIEKNLVPGSYRGLSLGGSGLDSETLLHFGAAFARVCAASSDRIILIVSGDLSHKLTPDGPYGFDSAGPAFDATFKEIVENNELLEFARIDSILREDAAECGLSGFIMCAGVLEELRRAHIADFGAELLSLEGPYGVGYGVAAFEKRKD